MAYYGFIFHHYDKKSDIINAINDLFVKNDIELISSGVEDGIRQSLLMTRTQKWPVEVFICISDIYAKYKNNVNDIFVLRVIRVTDNDDAHNPLIDFMKKYKK